MQKLFAFIRICRTLRGIDLDNDSNAIVGGDFIIAR